MKKVDKPSKTDKKKDNKICSSCGEDHSKRSDIVSFCPITFMNVFLAASK